MTQHDRNPIDRMNGRKTDGTFSAGNSGRPKGARNRTTQAALALLEGEGEAITRKAVAMALAGDASALRLCLERIAPPRKDAPVSFTVPKMQTASDAAAAAGAVLESVGQGDLTPIEGAHVMGLIESFRRTLETSDLETRLAALEARK